MPKKILLTSFDTWEPHQPSNSSDDLLEEMLHRNLFDQNCYLLRKIQVDFQLAPQQVISKMAELQPDGVICCGMAERRSTLTVESNGKHPPEILETTIDLHSLVQRTIATQISHDAGTFVCNALYYAVLRQIRDLKLNSQGLFVHVPLLNPDNLETIVNDFSILIGAI